MEDKTVTDSRVRSILNEICIGKAIREENGRNRVAWIAVALCRMRNTMVWKQQQQTKTLSNKDKRGKYNLQ